MRVAMVARTLPSVARGGIQTHILELGTALQDLGVDVTAYLIRADYPEDLPFDVVEVPYVPLPRLTAGEYISFSLAAGRRLASAGFDVVHGHAMYGWGSAFSDVHPLVITCHATQLNEFRVTMETTRDPNHRLTDYLSYRMERYAIRRADQVIAVSEENRGEVIEQYGVTPDLVHAVPNGVRPERFKVAEPEGPVVLSVGRLHQKKGIKHLIGAMPKVLERVPDARLLIAGKGEREAELKAQTRSLGLDDAVEFLGYVPDDELPDLYARSAVFALPSFYEGFGIVMIEAMAASLPVVAFRTGGAPEVVVHGETGYIADQDTLADRLVDVLEDMGRARAMGRRGRERVLERFTWKRVAEMTLEVYEAAIGAAGERRPGPAREG